MIGAASSSSLADRTQPHGKVRTGVMATWCRRQFHDGVTSHMSLRGHLHVSPGSHEGVFGSENDGAYLLSVHNRFAIPLGQLSPQGSPPPPESAENRPDRL